MKYVALIIMLSLFIDALIWWEGRGVYEITTQYVREILNPDLSGYTVEKISAMRPPLRQGKVSILPMRDFADLREYIKPDGRLQRHRLAQREIDPRAIVIGEGVYDLPRLYRAVNDDRFLEKKGGAYLLRLPLMVARDAVLSIEGELALSPEKAAFISNSGALFFINASVTGGGKGFRPFINNWGSLYIAGSSFSEMGHDAPKSYGVTWSVCSFCGKEQSDLPPPGGAVVKSKFTGLHHGLYASGARGIIIAGNVYDGSAADGISLHEGTMGTIIAKNAITRSGEDGLAILESPNVTTFGNKIHGNGRGGILARDSSGLRFSGDEIAENKGIPVTLHGGDTIVSGMTIRAQGVQTAFRLEGDGVLAFSGIRMLSAIPLLEGAGLKNVDRTAREVVVKRRMP